MADFQTDIHSIHHLVHTSRSKEEALDRFHSMQGFSISYDQAQKALKKAMSERFLIKSKTGRFVTSFFSKVTAKYEVTALAQAVHLTEIPAEYKDMPVIARGNTSIILEKDPKTVIMLTRDAMKKDWLNYGISIAKDFKIHDIPAKNRVFKDLALFAIEMPKLYKPNNENQAKIRKEVAFFQKAQQHVGYFKSKENIDKISSYYEEHGMENSLIYNLLQFLMNYYHDQWNWDIARRQFAQDAEGNLILLDPVVCAELAKAMHTPKGKSPAW